jgi:2,4-dienoyl-CoA reductase-like NADH-dependent reductase (Old Yellow Enzyme family)
LPPPPQPKIKKILGPLASHSSLSISFSFTGPHLGMTFPPTRPATTDEITHIVHAFAHAAEFLEAAGFDGVQLHAVHGFLLAQFLSPATKKRTDAYGGGVSPARRSSSGSPGSPSPH